MAGFSYDNTWTLFLDRDGVINHEKPGDYVYRWDEFIFYDGVLDALAKLSGIFGKIIVTTNQRGVGKGLMSEQDLQAIHHAMVSSIEAAGGRIDAIYYCTSMDNADPMRKPQPGMAFKAKADFPAISLERSVMIGNNISDMEFGKNAGMQTVFVKTTHPEFSMPHPLVDYAFNSLPEFAQALKNS